MQGTIYYAAELVRATRRIRTKKWRFCVLFVAIFALSGAVLGRLDLLPEGVVFSSPGTWLGVSKATTPTPRIESAATSTVAVVEEPLTIEVPAIGLSTNIANPTTTKVETLDALLLKGAVRYPTSAMLGEDGNVVLFGHSSYLPVVGNPAYKAFNDIQKLKAGDVVVVTAEERAYTYRVRTVAKENAADGAIPLMVTGRVLTLATCNSFGQKSDRFVVTADFVESHLVGA